MEGFRRIMLNLQFYTQFKRDLKLAKKRHFNIELLKNIVSKLRQGQKLEQKYCDHALTGKYIGYRECHIMPDWLLVYKIENDTLTLVLARTGTHSDLF